MKYRDLNITELKRICKERKIPLTGNKSDLLERLIEYDETSSIKLDLYNDNNSIDKNEIATLYFQLNKENLIYYFNSGIIYPLILEDNLIYKNENRKKDLLTFFQEHLIFTSKPIAELKDDEVLLEIIVNDINLIKFKNLELYYTTDLIPISRIKTISFRTAILIKSFLASVKIFPDTFIYEELCKVQSLNVETNYIDFNEIELPPNSEFLQSKKILNKFDKITGMFSFMKNSGIIYSDMENTYYEYSQTYLNLLSIINNKIELIGHKDMGLYKYILFPLQIEPTNIQRVLFRQILDSIYVDLEFNDKISKDIINSTINSNLGSIEEKNELNLVLNLLDKLENHKITFKDILFHDSIKKNYPLLALLFLNKYSNKSKQHTDKQAVRNIFISNEYNLTKNVTEFLLSVLGLYYGYKKMIKEDTNLNIKDLHFNALSNRQQSIKFKLDSTLERIVIESIYNFCKYDKVQSNNYNYLNFKALKNSNTVSSSNRNFDYVDKSVVFLNTKITISERINKTDEVLRLIDNNYSNFNLNKSFLFHYLIDSGTINLNILKEIIKLNSDKLDSNEIIKIIDFDKNRKNK